MAECGVEAEPLRVFRRLFVGEVSFARERRKISVVQVQEVVYEARRGSSRTTSVPLLAQILAPSLVGARKINPPLEFITIALTSNPSDGRILYEPLRIDRILSKIAFGLSPPPPPPPPPLSFCKEDRSRNHFPRIVFALRFLSESRGLKEIGALIRDFANLLSFSQRISPRTSAGRDPFDATAEVVTSWPARARAGGP